MIGRRVELASEIEKPGDYCWPKHSDSLWFLLPTADTDDPFWASDNGISGLRHITQPPWRFQEGEDGTVVVEGSIAAYGHDNKIVWHGWLERGVWREA